MQDSKQVDSKQKTHLLLFLFWKKMNTLFDHNTILFLVVLVLLLVIVLVAYCCIVKKAVYKNDL